MVTKLILYRSFRKQLLIVSIIEFHLKRNTVIGVINEDLKENEAFISFSKTFKELNLNVPKVLHHGSGNNVYLLNDLGDDNIIFTYPFRKHDYTHHPN